MEIIDCHVHIGEDVYSKKAGLLNVRSDQYKLFAENFIKIMDRYNVSKAMVMPFPSPQEFYFNGLWYFQENAHIKEICKSYNQKLIEVLAFHPDKNNLESIVDEQTKGLKLHTRATSTDPYDLINHPVTNLIEKFNIPLILHIGTGYERELVKKDITLKSAVELAKARPRIKFIFAHLGRLHLMLYDALRLPNVFFDTSGLSLLNTYKEKFCARESFCFFHPTKVIEEVVKQGFVHKILWGSDEPYGFSYGSELEYVLNASIGESDKKKILSENAREVFRL